MKNKFLKLLLITLVSIMSCTLYSCKKDKDKVASFPEIVSSIENYTLSGKLETSFPSGVKLSNVLVYYKKPDMYRVELVLPNSLEKQVIIKNKDGVFVLIPSINKNFKVSSSWPNQSSYPYLLQSLSKDIVSDTDLKKEVNGELITYTLKAHLYDNAVETYQKITFDNKNGLPKEVSIYKKEDNTLITHFTFSDIDITKKLDQSLFENKKSMETLKEVIKDGAIEFDRTMTYPTYCPAGITLKDEITTGSKDHKQILLTYAGSNYLTIYEKFIHPTENLKTEYLDGSISVLSGVCSVISDKTITFYTNGIEYTVASGDISKYELMSIGNSLTANEEK